MNRTLYCFTDGSPESQRVDSLVALHAGGPVTIVKMDTRQGAAGYVNDEQVVAPFLALMEGSRIVRTHQGNISKPALRNFIIL